MIARVWRGFTRRERSDEYLPYIQETGVRDCEATPGNRGVFLLRRPDGDRTEFLFISMWESMPAIRRFAGDDVERAVYYPRDAEFLLELDPHVRHYEVENAPAALGDREAGTAVGARPEAARAEGAL